MKSEIRNPKEIRSPKSEALRKAGAIEGAVFPARGFGCNGNGELSRAHTPRPPTILRSRIAAMNLALGAPTFLSALANSAHHANKNVGAPRGGSCRWQPPEQVRGIRRPCVEGMRLLTALATTELAIWISDFGFLSPCHRT